MPATGAVPGSFVKHVPGGKPHSAPSGTFIISGADGRGGRVTILKPPSLPTVRILLKPLSSFWLFYLLHVFQILCNCTIHASDEAILYPLHMLKMLAFVSCSTYKCHQKITHHILYVFHAFERPGDIHLHYYNPQSTSDLLNFLDVSFTWKISSNSLALVAGTSLICMYFLFLKRHLLREELERPPSRRWNDWRGQDLVSVVGRGHFELNISLGVQTRSTPYLSTLDLLQDWWLHHYIYHGMKYWHQIAIRLNLSL